MLTKEYIDLGFQLSKLEGLHVLEYRNRIFFIIGDTVHIRNGLTRKLCDTYRSSFLSSPHRTTSMN